MSTYDQLPTDPLVLVSCIQSTGGTQPQYEVGVNTMDSLPFKCTDVLNQYHKRGVTQSGARSARSGDRGLFCRHLDYGQDTGSTL